MKPYTDTLGKPIKQEDVMLVVQVVIKEPMVTRSGIARKTRLGIGKLTKILDLLEKAIVVSPSNDAGMRTVILRNEAAARNAALRQLNKGRK